MSAPIIMFDGADGVGKTTQLTLVKQKAEQAGLKVHSARVLGGTDFGEALREVILSDRPRVPLADMHTVLAMSANLGHEIDALRNEVELLLIDRSPLAILGFQVAGSGLDPQTGRTATETSLSYMKPDLICVYDAPLETLRRRLPTLGTSGSGDYFEDQQLDYHGRVIEAYRLAAADFAVATIIDATGDKEAVLERTLAAMDEKLQIKL